LTATSIWLQLDTHKLLEINPEIKEINEGGESRQITIQNIKQIIGAKLQKVEKLKERRLIE
jgi:hypothetical protein